MESLLAWGKSVFAPEPPEPEPEPLPYMKLVLAFMCTMFLFLQWLETRQLHQLKKREPPMELRSVISAKEFKAARAYGLDKWYFRFFQSTVDAAESVAFLALGGLAALWASSSEWAARLPFLRHVGDEETQTSVVFTLAFALASIAMQQPFVR